MLIKIKCIKCFVNFHTPCFNNPYRVIYLKEMSCGKYLCVTMLSRCNKRVTVRNVTYISKEYLGSEPSLGQYFLALGGSIGLHFTSCPSRMGLRYNTLHSISLSVYVQGFLFYFLPNCIAPYWSRCPAV